MSDGQQLPAQPEDLTPVRPDPLFKVVFRTEAVANGLQLVDTEFQYSTRADTVAIVPAGVGLEGTLFDFFRRDNIVEFKGENDRFDLREYARNALRTYYQFLQSNDEDFRHILNVIVSARLPKGFLSVATAHGIIYRQVEGRPWLWRGSAEFQNVVIVVCRDLPLEPLYYPWLVFAPTGGKTWEKLVRQLVRENNDRYLRDMRRLRPKEVKAMIDQSLREMVEEAIAKGIVPPSIMEELNQPVLNQESQDRVMFATTYLEDIAEYDHDKLAGVLNVLKPEDRLTGLSTEERLANIPTEDRLTGLSTEERKKLLELLSKEQKESN